MVSFTLFTTAAIVAFAATAAPTGPLDARGGQCSFELACTHTYGGGGGNGEQQVIDMVACEQIVKGPGGNTLIHTDTDMQNGHPDITFKAGDYKGSNDVAMVVNFERASNHIGTCNYSAGSNKGSGSVKGKIDEGTVTESTSTCTFSLPCNA